MNKANLYFLFAFVAILLSAACRKVNVDGIYTPSAETYLSSQFLQRQLPEPEKITIDIDSAKGDTIIELLDGNELYFNPKHIKTKSGAAATGIVEVRYINLINKSDYIFAEKPSVAENELLISRGTYHLSIWKEDERLHIDSLTLKVPTVFGEDLDTEMEFFLPGTTLNGEFTWQQNTVPEAGDLSFEVQGDTIPRDTSSSDTITRFYERNKYVMVLRNDSLDWINCDKFYGLNVPKTDLRFTFSKEDVILLDDAELYVVFGNFRSVIQGYREDDNHFLVSNVPIDEPIGVAVVAFQGIDVFSATFLDVTKQGYNRQVTLNETTENELVSAIRSLY